MPTVSAGMELNKSQEGLHCHHRGQYPMLKRHAIVPSAMAIVRLVGMKVSSYTHGQWHGQAVIDALKLMMGLLGMVGSTRPSHGRCIADRFWAIMTSMPRPA